MPLRDSNAEGVITGRGDFRAELTLMRLDRLLLQRSRETLPRVAYSVIDPKLFGIVFSTCPASPGSVSGLELPHDKYRRLPRRIDTYNCIPASFR
jgi:hypothetical protein